MHPIGTKVMHLQTGDYGFVVEIPNKFKCTSAKWDTWVLWLTGLNTAGRVFWEDPKFLYPTELEEESDEEGEE